MIYHLQADATFDATNIDEAFLVLAKFFEAQAQERATDLEYKGTITVELQCHTPEQAARVVGLLNRASVQPPVSPQELRHWGRQIRATWDYYDACVIAIELDKLADWMEARNGA